MERLAHKVLRWHKQLSVVTGGLALAIGRKSITRREALEWGTKIQVVAQELLALAEQKDDVSAG